MSDLSAQIAQVVKDLPFEVTMTGRKWVDFEAVESIVGRILQQINERDLLIRELIEVHPAWIPPELQEKLARMDTLDSSRVSSPPQPAEGDK